MADRTIEHRTGRLSIEATGALITVETGLTDSGGAPVTMIGIHADGTRFVSRADYRGPWLLPDYGNATLLVASVRQGEAQTPDPLPEPDPLPADRCWRMMVVAEVALGPAARSAVPEQNDLVMRQRFAAFLSSSGARDLLKQHGLSLRTMTRRDVVDSGLSDALLPLEIDEPYCDIE